MSASAAAIGAGSAAVARAGFRARVAFCSAAVLLLACAGPREVCAVQDGTSFEVMFDDGSLVTLPVERDRGYAAVHLDALGLLGWVQGDSPGGEAGLAHVGGSTLHLWSGSPMLLLDDQLLQMADPSYAADGVIYVPLQLVVDLIPVFGPGGYTADESRLAAGTEPSAPVDGPPALDVVPSIDVAPADGATLPNAPDSATVAAGDVDVDVAPAADVAPEAATPVALVASSAPPLPGAYDLIRGGDRLVVIDAGHGGADVGAVGPGGSTEKGVALGVALALARELASRPGLDVRVIRDRDIEVHPEYRGEWANQWKGDRPGVFVSIHVNSLPERTGVRGFETYTLGCPTTEQERRVSAIENGTTYVAPAQDAASPLSALESCPAMLEEPERLSAPLAARVQQEIGTFHPGQDRGVRRGSFNVLPPQMPAVLIEIGFITNPEEARALARPEFHRQAAGAIAQAIDGFFESGPPGGLP
jgi:N-acetylmuramoyl-L-alanine amidase